jgi:hypothetical protein
LARKCYALGKFKEQGKQAKACKEEQERVYQAIVMEHQEVQRQMEAQKEKLESASRELAKGKWLIERYEEIL